MRHFAICLALFLLASTSAEIVLNHPNELSKQFRNKKIETANANFG